jgi:hypothetical protein
MTHSREEQTLKRICNGAKIGAVVGTGLGIFSSIETPLPDGSNNDIEWAVIAIFSTAVFACTGACVFGTAIAMASSVLQTGTDALNNARRTLQNTSNTQNLLRDNPATPTRKDTAENDDFEDYGEYEQSGFGPTTVV